MGVIWSLRIFSPKRARMVRVAGTVSETDVIVVGAGPVGLWLAAELQLGGAMSLCWKNVTSARRIHVRLRCSADAGGVRPRGLAGDGWRGASASRPPTTPCCPAAWTCPSSTPTSRSCCSCPQVRTEELLEEHAMAGGRAGPARPRGHLRWRPTTMACGSPPTRADGPREFGAAYLAGCDGRRSIVRDAAGIGYEGTEDTITCVIGDVHVADATCRPALTLHSAGGSFYGVRLDRTRHRLIGIEHATMTTRRERAAGVRRVPGHDRAADRPGLRHARPDLADPGGQPPDLSGRPVLLRPDRAGRGRGSRALSRWAARASTWACRTP